MKAIHDPERELARAEELLRLEKELWVWQLRRAAFHETCCQIADAAGVPLSSLEEEGEVDSDASADRFAATFDPGTAVERNPAEARKAAAWFRETFTPERTARRAVRAVLARYAGPEDSASAREAFLERMLPSVEAGILRARKIVSSLSEEVRAEFESTALRVRDLLQVFGFSGKTACLPGRRAA